jgi:hypothetical protein
MGSCVVGGGVRRRTTRPENRELRSLREAGVSKLARPHEVLGSGAIRYRYLGPHDAPTALLLAVDYTDAPVPQHYYVSDFLYVANFDPQVLFVFGKKESAGSPGLQLRNKIEVFFPAIYFVNQLWRSSRDFHEKLRKMVQHYQYETPAVSPADLSCQKVQTFHSNNVMIVLSGGEAMLDFFYISPRDLYLKPRRRETIGLEALVRVIIAPNLLLSLLDACQPMAQALEEKYKEQEVPNDNLEFD